MSLFHFSSGGKKKGRQSAHGGKARQRPDARLAVEMLEDRLVPAGLTISGYVFNDLSNTGIINSNDPIFPNAVVQLQQQRNGQTVVVGSTTTSASGYYQFNTDQTIDTSPHSITQTVTIPATATDFSLTNLVNQFNPALGQLQSVVISDNASITSDIKVENTSTSSPSTINATVGGTQTLTGPGGVQIVVSLQQNAGTFNATTYDGTLDFGGSSGTDFGAQTASGSQSTTIQGANASPFIGTGTVSFTENGVATSKAAGGGNLVVSLVSTGQATYTVTYNYIPDNSLKPGNYTVVELTTPSGFVPGLVSSNGVVLGNPPGDEVIPVALTTGNAPHNDFAFLQPSSLSGYVYADTSPGGFNDGLKEPGEAGIAGVTITLTGTSSQGVVNTTVKTDANGYYDFANLTPGNYTVTETPPSGYVIGKDTIGSQGGSTGQNQFTNIGLGAGVNGINNNFAVLVTGSITGTVYYDANDNGALDSSEPGVGGVAVQLSGTNYLGNAVTASAVTNAAGGYSFQNLMPGTYAVSDSPPGAYMNGKDSVGTLGGVAGTNILSGISMPAGGQGINYNFGLVLPASVSGYVYVDNSTAGYNNGVKDPGEAGLGGVVVTLTGTNDLGATVTLQQTTNAAGYYTFAGLRPGTYALSKGGVTGYIDGKTTPGSQGGVGTTDHLTGVVLAANVNSVNNNFAELPPVIHGGGGGTPTNPELPLVITPTPPDFITPPIEILSKGQLLSSTVSNPSGTMVSNARFINALYNTMYGRDADAGAVAIWLSYLGTHSRSALVNTLWNSYEHRMDQIITMYKLIYNGAVPAQTTITAYWNEFQAGYDETGVLISMLTSTQTQMFYTTQASYITLLFTIGVGRTPTTAELTAYLALNLDRATLANDILCGSVSRTIVIAQAYQELLGRAPSAAETAAWLAAMQGGQTYGQFAMSLLSSAEFSARIG
jgi:protocatechuate 3,4-dioxygenase beta subunit